MMLSCYDKVPDVKKIAVLRANALGDFIFALPALEALRIAYPQAEMVLLGKDWHARFLGGRPSPIDRVISIPQCEGVGKDAGASENPAELHDFFQCMQQEHFDLALQWHGGGRFSNPFLLRLGARVTAGLKSEDAEPLDRWIPYIYFQHEVLRYLEIASLVGATAISMEPHIVVTPEDRAEAENVIPYTCKPLVALHPGATDPRRRWPIAKFAAVGDALTAEGAQVVVTGTRQEHDLTRAVVNSMRYEAWDLAGRLSLGSLAGLFSRCHCVISNDTGPLHLAAAVGASTVSIYWCFNLVNASPLTRMRHRPFVSWLVRCPVCGADLTQNSACNHEVSHVSNVSAHEVTAAALDLIALRNGATTAHLTNASSTR